ncbi:phosphate ABC transporter substrate-binding protein [Sinanaerobacter chloroacetimidivorans]|uniref:Phosphate-binding protein n=1 Tax=Sinanaerobacter chloroacetimidivorans TaxID=2818044 RepID=A0A8J8B024_9FIRM|nr:phosphate ABC transporter substrate-binding protein [Sinanaerobacter chloroacetimidivorans]MBR0597143.1 phosphate ABC transporter substrate-binding protein PstS family protein [Sinanaerobacter chloroacetimidivorans]
MKKILSITLVILLALGALAGCGAKDSTGDDGNNGNASDVTGTVVTAGSTSVQPLSEELAAAFMDANPGISVEVQGGGSGQGIKAIQEKIADFGALSRNVKDEEKGSVAEEFIIAKDGVAVVVNPESTVTDLTIEQIKKIYTGEIKNWKEVGGEDAPIVVVSREEGSGTRGAFTEITKVMSKNEAGEEIDGTTKDALVQGSTGAVMQTVATTPNTIGYVSLGSLSDSVKVVKVEGVAPSEETVLSGEYKISRPFIYVVSGELTEAAKLYIDFVMSEEGQAIVEESGFIPVI